MNDNAAFLACLLTLDLPRSRALWLRTHPELPQPKTDDEMLMLLHIARVQSKAIPAKLKRYSRRFLEERETGSVALAVGIAVGAPPHRARRALAIRDAMQDSVERSVKHGIHLDHEAQEVKRRLLAARDKEMGIGKTTTSS